MNNNSIPDKKVKLIYFRTYGDFSYDIGENFTVNIFENEKQETEFYAVHMGISKRVLIICQPALSVFRYLSPDEVLYHISGYLTQLFERDMCKMLTSVDALLSNIIYFLKEK